MRRTIGVATVLWLATGAALAQSGLPASSERMRQLEAQSRLLDGRLAQQYSHSARLLPPSTRRDAVIPRWQGRYAGPWLEPARAAAREVVGSAAEAITARGRPGRSSRTSELLSRALAAATDAEIVIHGRLSGHDLPAGEITREDVFRIVPYENAVGIVDLRKPELVAVVEEQLAMYGSYVACGVYGVFVEFDRENRVVELYDRERNPLPAADRLYRTAFNSYTLAGGGGRFPVLREIVERAREQGRVEDPGLWSRDAVVEYLRANPDLTVKPVRWLL